MSQTITIPEPTTDTARTEKPKRRWLLLTALGIGGLVIGMGLGAVAGGATSVEDTEEYQALQAELAAAETAADEAIAEAEASLADREAAVTAAEAEAAALLNDAETVKAEADQEAAAVLTSHRTTSSTTSRRTMDAPRSPSRASRTHRSRSPTSAVLFRRSAKGV